MVEVHSLSIIFGNGLCTIPLIASMSDGGGGFIKDRGIFYPLLTHNPNDGLTVLLDPLVE